MDGNGNPCGMWCLDCLALNKIQIDPHQKCKCVIFPTFTGATYPKTYQSATQYIIAHGSSIWGKCHLSRSLNIAHYLGCTSVKGIDKLPVVIGARSFRLANPQKWICTVAAWHLRTWPPHLHPSNHLAPEMLWDGWTFQTKDVHEFSWYFWPSGWPMSFGWCHQKKPTEVGAESG